MNCEKCQELINDLLDGSLNREDELNLNSHLNDCLDCQSVRADLQSIVTFCQTHRGEYSAPPNERALWLRIRNTLEAERPVVAAPSRSSARQVRPGWLGRSWELSLPQLAGSIAGIILLVSLTTVVGLRRWESMGPRQRQPFADAATMNLSAANVLDRTRQQQQMIDYWNQRVEMNKVRWSPQMRATFDRNLKVIDQAVNDSLTELSKNPHDEVSEEMLNSALNEKLAILKEFADL
jgi:Putative zinc-finger